MILLDDEFMKAELNFVPVTENNEVLYKDYFYKICAYISNNSVVKFLPSQIEKHLNPPIVCGCEIRNILGEERTKLFKRAVGLQILYDINNGRNTMTTGSNSEEDICRETKDILNSLGLLKMYGVVKRWVIGAIWVC